MLEFLRLTDSRGDGPLENNYFHLTHSPLPQHCSASFLYRYRSHQACYSF